MRQMIVRLAGLSFLTSGLLALLTGGALAFYSGSSLPSDAFRAGGILLGVGAVSIAVANIALVIDDVAEPEPQA